MDPTGEAAIALVAPIIIKITVTVGDALFLGATVALWWALYTVQWISGNNVTLQSSPQWWPWTSSTWGWQILPSYSWPNPYAQAINIDDIVVAQATTAAASWWAPSPGGGGGKKDGKGESNYSWQDKDTILKDSKQFDKTNKSFGNSSIYREKSTWNYYYRDPAWKNPSLNHNHLEVFNKRWQHIGTADPVTWKINPNSAVKWRSISNLLK